ncbi:MAG: hypothetical protein KDB03_11635 [Planctomycetales bacterium]|nr:hypothetical protein [Planctomycetales bacterium]
MSICLRSFRNTDLKHICRIWNEHHFESKLGTRLTPLQFEICVLAKPNFSAENFFIAELDDIPCGFLYLDLEIEAETGEFCPSANISAFCVSPCAEDEPIAGALLTKALDYCFQSKVQTCQFRPLFPANLLFVGLGPGDSMIGLTSSERRLCDWLTQGGFTALIPTNLWQLDVSTFQQPSDRVQLGIRRSSYVDRLLEEPELSWKVACLLGHAELSEFHLINRQSRQITCDSLIWTLDPELSQRAEYIAWLWPLDQQIALGKADESLFLLGEAIRQLQQDGVDYVRTASIANQNIQANLLSRLGFIPFQSGVVFEYSFQLAQSL